MSYTDRNLKLVDLALKYGEASRELGFINGVMASHDAFAEAVETERQAWQAFSDALWGKDSPQPEETAGGVKSTPIHDPFRTPKIGTHPTFTGEPA